MSHEPTSIPVNSQTEQPASISTDTVYDILAHEHRRIALQHLTRTKDPVPVDALVETVTNEINHEDTASTRKRIAILFHHSHLPKMADAGFIEYDESQTKVTLTTKTSTIQSALATY